MMPRQAAPARNRRQAGCFSLKVPPKAGMKNRPGGRVLRMLRPADIKLRA